MKTPLFALLLLLPLHPMAFASDDTECPATESAAAKRKAPAAAPRPVAKPTELAPPPAPSAERPRRHPAPRPPAHLFM